MTTETITTENQVTRSIDLKAPIEKVWKALTDHRQFSQWFGASVETAFVPGQVSPGRISCSGFENVKWEIRTEKMLEPTYFSLKWHPFAVKPDVDYSHEPQTLVEFQLEQLPSGTRVTVTESGFDALPEHRRAEAFEKHSAGWGVQIENLRNYVDPS